MVSSNSPKKTNELIRRSSKNEFVCSFFGRIWGCQKSFRNYLTFNTFGEMKKNTSIKSFTLFWMSNLKLKSWSDSNWCSQHKVMLGKVIFYSRTLSWWIFWSKQNCSLFNSRFCSLEKGSLSKRSCLSHCQYCQVRL